MTIRRVLDEALPANLVKVLAEHDCLVQPFPKAWRGLGDGLLLDLFDAEGGGVLVTCDRNMQHQQRFDRRRIGLVVLPGQRLAQLLLIASEIADVVRRSEARQIIVLDRTGRASFQPV